MASHDALRRYKATRNLSITSEPADDDEVGADALLFVSQMHWANHLQNDFRLERRVQRGRLDRTLG